MSWVRASLFANFFEVAQNVGLDPYRMLRRARISPSSFVDPETHLPLPAVLSLLEDCAAEAECPSFGMMLAEVRQASSLGALGLLALHEATLRRVIEAIIRYRHLLSDDWAMTVEAGPRVSTVVVGLVADYPYPARQGVELGLTAITRSVEAIGGPRWRPECILFEHAAPPDARIARRIQQCPIQYDAGFSGASYLTSALDLPNPHAEPRMARHAERFLEILPASVEAGSVVARTRKSIQLLLPLGRATLPHVAEHQGMHPRNLQRALEKQESRFADLLNEARIDMARRYLAAPDQPVGTVAQLLGYATPSSFTRWFNAEFGMSPAAWRAQSVVAPPPFPDA